ncbi:lysine--tRNA ligase [Candidatus Uhrbacteria bacterium RIFCSPHIGHO2_02_FULL_53_13]|uniref:Lysine--tRNA ligase n=1 Tax=Candidatus Uhrbacteria bacterium RIFCSPHIGHO2_02_FULL_53_13 TaxID=1802389 RepID=A0A1F7TYM3_9BACT|nr:MAG: lysine--tRNA ligase [Candidatus Uhrbacteria bacterium RIFCSPHIGHO2_02_FULL_53_13]
MINEETERRARLQRLLNAGKNPFPSRVLRTHTLQEVVTEYASLEASKTIVSVVGRVRAVRQHGKLLFIKLEDGFGEGQLLVRTDAIGSVAYEEFMATVDVGDFVEGSGPVMRTKTGQESLAVTQVRIIAKALRPLPEKWHGLSDVEMRFRQRELDLITNPAVRHTFVQRAHIISAIRRFFDDHGFLEVDTPILQHVAAGASARPFVTHHNALDEDLYLRIAPELFLKRCVIGGFERVYEIARCFRNEGIDHTHNPEFSQVEAYAAYMDYETLMGFMEELICALIDAIGLDRSAVPFSGHTLDFSNAIPRKTYRDLIVEKSGIDVDTLEDVESARTAARTVGVDVQMEWSLGTVIDEIWKKAVRPSIVQPIFVTDYPASITPLAKRKEDNQNRIEMFQLVVGGGLEIMKAFGELNDPVDQEMRMNENEEAHQRGDDDAQRRDDAFIRAMQHGMPPMSGVGMGIERITQVLTDSHNIKEVILFPTLRSEASIESRV